MIKGECLCGSVKFEIDKFIGPFEMCHCPKCRKVSGSAFLATIYSSKEDFRYVAGEEYIQTYTMPIVEKPPAYQATFCTLCGSPVPNPKLHEKFVEIPAGTLDNNLKQKPDKHIFIEKKAPWFEITDTLQQYTKEQLKDLRNKSNEK